MEDLTNLWSKTLEILEGALDALSINTWINPLKPVQIDGNDIYIKAENDFMKGLVENRYSNLIKNAVNQVSQKNYNIVIISSENSNTPEIKENNTLIAEAGLAANLNPRYVFESFVVGNSNRMAHAASLAVAEAPAKAYNPLFLYGNVGLGKTHLMHSIAHYILNKNPNTKVLYVTSETFTNELINAIRNNKNEEFRNKYRNIDVLLIDDIQFIAEKVSTQEEFFHTFNALHSANKQIILSSDRSPKDINPLEERLRSRFAGGLIADIQPPDIETRIAILRNKANHEGYIVSDKALSHIAKYIQSNIRELEGALTRVMMYASLTNSEVTTEFVENSLQVYGDKKQKQITASSIIDVISSYYNISSSDVRGSKKPKNIAYPRQIAMYLCRKMLDISLKEVGDEFGGRDHTTVLHAEKKIESDLQKNDSELKKDIEELKKRIQGI
ncbi:MAG: chromosomal replication initiator protein DnaA [Firmicutes bacterium]|nr:chromosomal replication initiator protein DnaA [Bacillota bacterium]